MLEAKQEGVAPIPVSKVTKAVCVSQPEMVPTDEVSPGLLKSKGHFNHYPVIVLFDFGSTEDVVLFSRLS